jgi:hypothetical protein
MHFNFFFFLDLTKILVYHSGGGASGSGRVEIINLDQANPNFSCYYLSNFPLSTVGAVGNLYQGTTPIICGGFTFPIGGGTATYRCECYSFKNGAWMPEAPLNTCRRGSKSVCRVFY